MDKKKKNTYLSELFLENLNGDFSRLAVLRALEKCNDEVLKRMGTYPCTKWAIDYFFYREKQTKKLSKQIMQELVDFWDVYGEFDNMLRPSVKRNYLILQML
ncbi:hypothetical protein [Sporofaciens musculi]|uniref:hypothetical protein n=1 Tax=Sporofaciens musculi TaxID=2681861 RepID=UPI0025A21A6A|nr:hypothetical protein [Sporofaciens musculi]